MGHAHRLRKGDVPWSSETGAPHDDLELVAIIITITNRGSTATNIGHNSLLRM
jgi:hypothetical protein